MVITATEEITLTLEITIIKEGHYANPAEEIGWLDKIRATVVTHKNACGNSSLPLELQRSSSSSA